MSSAERWVGVLLLLFALLGAGVAWGFRVNFIADPVGPRAFPLAALALIAAGALRMVARPVEERADADESTPDLRIGAALLTMAVVPLLLPTLGFVVAVGAAMWVLAVLMGGRVGPSALAAFGLAGGLFLLFVHGLGVPLPVGSLLALLPGGEG